MKIAIFHNVPSGGAKRVVYEQVKFLSRDNNVIVYEPFWENNGFLNLSNLVNVKKYKFEINNKLPRILSRLKSDWDNFITLAKLHKKIAEDIDSNSYDVVIVHPDRYTQAPFLLRYLKTPNVYYCEEALRIIYEDKFKFSKNVFIIKKYYEELTRKIRKNIDRENIFSSDAVLGNSKFTCENIKKAYRLDAKVCYPGVDIKTFKPQKIKKNNDILFIGEKIEVEGYPILEEAISYFKNKPKIKILGRKANNKFRLNDTKLVKEINKSKIVVVLNRDEPFGLLPIESMACGVLVVGVNEGGFRETIINNRTGFLIDRDPYKLYVILKKLLNNEILRKNIGKNAIQYIEKKWTWEKSNLRLLEIIKEILLIKNNE